MNEKIMRAAAEAILESDASEHAPLERSILAGTVASVSISILEEGLAAAVRAALDTIAEASEAGEEGVNVRQAVLNCSEVRMLHSAMSHLCDFALDVARSAAAAECSPDDEEEQEESNNRYN